MMTKILKSWLVLVVVILAAVVLLGATGERKAVVHSEPLPCVIQGDTLICIDGIPGPNMVCQKLDAHDILCSGSPRC